MKKTWQYSASTTILWASFDFGQVEAETREEAMALALKELDYNFEKANEAFIHCDNTKHFSLEYNRDEVEITEVS